MYWTNIFSYFVVVKFIFNVKYIKVKFYALRIARVIKAKCNFWFYYFTRLGTTIALNTRICHRDSQKLR